MTGSSSAARAHDRWPAARRNVWTLREGRDSSGAAEPELARQVLDTLLTFVGLLSADGVVIDANEAALAAAGLRADDVVGRPFWETPWWSWSRDEQARLRESIASCAAGERVRYDAEIRVADDERIVIDFQLAPLRDADGEIRLLVPSGIDVTARRLAEDTLGEIVAFAPIGFAQFDHRLRFVRVNEELAAMNGLPAAAHLGRTPMELFPGLPPESYLPHFRAALGGETSEFELEGETEPDGRRVWLSRVYPLRDRDGRLLGIGVFVLDITERKDIERERQRSVEALQHSLLPRRIPALDGLSVATRYETGTDATEVGGDFYEVLADPAFDVAVFVGDVCGRGLEAAALTALSRYTLVPLIERHPTSPAEALTELNRIILTHHPEAMSGFVTIALATLGRGPGGVAVRLALGGHPPPVLVRRRGRAELVGRPGTLIGIQQAARAFDVDVTLAAGDALVLYTDGYTEARHRSGEMFGEARLLAAATAAAGGSAERIAAAIGAAVDDWTTDAISSDDRALMVVKVSD